MNWGTMRRIATIAPAVVAAATIAGRVQSFWQPGRVSAGLASMLWLARGSLTGARAGPSTNQPFYRHALRATPCAMASKSAALVRLKQALGTRWPSLLRCDRRG